MRAVVPTLPFLGCTLPLLRCSNCFFRELGSSKWLWATWHPSCCHHTDLLFLIYQLSKARKLDSLMKAADCEKLIDDKLLSAFIIQSAVTENFKLTNLWVSLSPSLSSPLSPPSGLKAITSLFLSAAIGCLAMLLQSEETCSKTHDNQKQPMSKLLKSLMKRRRKRERWKVSGFHSETWTQHVALWNNQSYC